VVIQFRGELLGEGWQTQPEWLDVQALMHRSGQGVVFGQSMHERVGPRLLALADQSPRSRLLTLLTVLGELADSSDYQLLDAGEPGLLLSSADYDRIHRVMEYLHAHFRESIPLETVAALLPLTVPAFCRFFKRITRKTFNAYLHEYRVYQACLLLQDHQLSIGEVAYQVGYQQPAYFNRQFKRITGQTPGAYQRRFARWVPS
jgi:AraC-like DNA-binding protein